LRDDTSVQKLVAILLQNMTFNSIGFGMAAIITFIIFILNDIVDQGAEGSSHTSILTIKLESATIVVFVYVLILIAIYQKSYIFKQALNNLIGAQIDTSLRLKLQTHMRVSPHEFGKILSEHYEEFNFTTSG